MDQIIGGGSSSLREVVNHPAHRHAGPLTLSSYVSPAGGLDLGPGYGDFSSSSCSICGAHLTEHDSIYRCPDPDCDFAVDVACSSMTSVIEFEGHRHHPLCFIERAAAGISCRSCAKGPSDAGQPVFRCGECGFSLHLLCGPLPGVVQYKGYELTLTNSLLEGVDADDCWCDICEQQRDPAQCVYHNPDIRFTASIDCLLPQIIPALKGDLGVVELLTVGSNVPGKVIVENPTKEDAQIGNAENEIHGDEAAQEEASTSEGSEEASGNSFLAMFDLLTYLVVPSGNEDVHPATALKNIFSDTFGIGAKEVNTFFALLALSLTDEQAQELDDAFNTISRRMSTAKVDLSHPYSNVLQWYKEKDNISDLEEQVMPETEDVGEVRTITYIQCFRSLTPMDYALVECAFSKCPRGENQDAASNNYLFAPFSYSDEAYSQFKKQLDIADSVEDSYMMGWKRQALKIVKVGETMIPSYFVPVYREFVGKYGDLSAGTGLSPVAQALFFHHFFTVVYGMRGTQVHEIADDLLCTWQFYLRRVLCLGFEIQFVLDRWESLVRACFGLKVIKFRDETTEKLEKLIEELSRKTREQESKLGMLKSIKERYRKPEKAEESRVKQSLVEAAKWKWKDLGDLIF